MAEKKGGGEGSADVDPCGVGGKTSILTGEWGDEERGVKENRALCLGMFQFRLPDVNINYACSLEANYVPLYIDASVET